MNCDFHGFNGPPPRQASDSDCLAVGRGDDLPLGAWARRRAGWVERAALAVALAAVLAFALPFLQLAAR